MKMVYNGQWSDVSSVEEAIGLLGGQAKVFAVDKGAFGITFITLKDGSMAKVS
jgi:hypothetical protein